MTCTLLPLLPPLLSNTLSLTTYNIKARHSSQAFVPATGNLQGLVVPTDRDDTLDEVAAENRQDIFNRIRAGRGLSQQEYIKTVISLADFLQKEDVASARFVVIDQTNPLPFVLGAPAPRGGDLWSGDIDWRPAEEALREADYVAIPHFPTDRATLLSGLKAYQEYLSTRFVPRYEMPYWTVLGRRNGQ
jgi:hypothetical protein